MPKPHRIALGLALLGVAVCVGADAQTYDLRSQYQAGQIIYCREGMQMRLHVVQDGTGDGEEPIVYATQETSLVKYTVVDTHDGKASVIDAEVLAAETVEEEPGDEPVRKASPLVGTTVTVKAGEDGESTYFDAAGKPLDPKEAGYWCSALEEDVTIHVDVAAAKVGDEWTLVDDVARRVFKVSPQGSASAKLRFAEIVNQDGRELARGEFEAAIEDALESELGGQAKVKLNGEMLFDLDRHVLYQVKGAGTVQVTIALQDEGEGAGVVSLQGPIALRSDYSEAPPPGFEVKVSE